VICPGLSHRSNTKAGIYLDTVDSSPVCREIIRSTPAPNAVTRLQEKGRDDTVQLSMAGDMLEMLFDGIVRSGRVKTVRGDVEEISLADEVGALLWPSPLAAVAGRTKADV
jgi:hypothetical protein